MRMNTKMANPFRTFEGAPAIRPHKPIDQLRRAVATCLLWENQFYEDGVSIADRIEALVKQCDKSDVEALAVEARHQMKLRHAPLWLLVALARDGRTADAMIYAKIINRADEMGELIAMFWKDGKRPLPAQMKRGIAHALGKFDEYRLAKYDRKVTVKLRDVLRLTHPKPVDAAQSEMWGRLIDGRLKTPDTWETALSSGANKRDTFERLLANGKLGYLALLRNLRNMAESGVDTEAVRHAILARKGAHNILPFRYVAAARAAPQFEPALDQALCASINEAPLLGGKTAVLVDVSGSMDWALSDKSDMTRMDAAATLASIINGDVRVFTFSNSVVEVAPRRGMAGVDAVRNSQPRGGTYLGAAVDAINREVQYDRLIVITDEQSHDVVGAPKGRGYMMNVASHQNGVGYGDWVRISGFSENVVRFIREAEK